jgi:hypothetical protein
VAARAIPKARLNFSNDVPKAVVTHDVSRAGIVSVNPADLLKTDEAQSQIKALEHIHERARRKSA